MVTWLPWLPKLKRTFYDGYHFEYLRSYLAHWRRALLGLYFENKQVDNMGGTSGGDTWFDHQVRIHA